MLLELSVWICVFLQRNLLEKQKQDESILLEKAKYVCSFME